MTIGVATGLSSVDAARMAVDDELAAAPVAGVDTVMMPEGSTLAAPAIEAAQSLVEHAGIVAVIGHANSSASLAAAPIYNEHEVVQLAPAASAPAYSEAGPYSFRLVPPDDRQGAFLAERLGDLLPDGGRVAVAYVNDDYGRGLRQAFLRHRSPDRYPVVVELPHVEAELQVSDLEHAVAALDAARPDVLMWLARGNLLARFIAPVREVLPDTPILGGDAVATASAVPPRRRRWGEVQFAGFVDLGATEALRTFARRYRERFGVQPTGPDALTYDAVRLVITGVRRGAGTGPELREYLRSLGRTAPPYRGLTGEIVFDRDGDVARSYVLETLSREGG